MHILVAEDSERLSNAISLGFRQAGYVVDRTADGKDALWRARNETYDALVLDIMLPSMDGLSIVRTLRAEGTTTHILLLTAKDTVADRVRGLQLGADDYLVKPFAFEELLARVGALCRRGYNKKSPTVIIENLQIDFAAQTVASAGAVVDLLPREFRLLRFLLFRHGEVISRTEIEEHLYGDNVEVMSNAVDSTVCQLRKKLPLASGAQLIVTRRGLGYVINAGVA